MKSSSNHWDSVFSGTEDSKLGWYENDVSKTIELLNYIPKWKNSTIFLAGAGTSILIEQLLDNGIKLVLNDISIEALNRVKGKFANQYKNLYWICQDISQPIQDEIPEVNIWIDRAVLHFLNNKHDIKGYFENVFSILKVGGYAIFAEFAKTGATKCAGLAVHQYDVEELSARLGSFFKLVSCFSHTYINPNGEPRPYIYALYKKVM